MVLCHISSLNLSNPHICVCVRVCCVCVCVCVCVRMCVYVCVCVRERKKETFFRHTDSLTHCGLLEGPGITVPTFPVPLFPGSLLCKGNLTINPLLLIPLVLAALTPCSPQTTVASLFPWVINHFRLVSVPDPSHPQHGLLSWDARKPGTEWNGAELEVI